MKYLLLILLFCGCSISSLNQKKPKGHTNQTHITFSNADKNNDMMLDVNESISFISSVENNKIYSSVYSFSLIILLVFVFTVVCIFISNKKK